MPSSALAAPAVLEIVLDKSVYYDIASDSQGRKAAAIREATLRANPTVTAFETTRRGDDITLRFGFGEGIERTDFRLLGTKHEFYRLSMGVRLEETLNDLARGDPNIEPVGAEKSGDRITLRVAYAWPEGHVPAYAVVLESEPEPPPLPPTAVLAPEPAVEHPPARNPRYYVPAKKREYMDTPVVEMAAKPDTPPAAAESAVAVEPPHLPPVGIVPAVRESTATDTPAQAKLPRPAARTRAAMDYKAALEAGTLKALSRFLDTHPDSRFSAEARIKAAELREQAAYTKTVERDNAAGYRGFLENFPDSARRGEIQARLAGLEEKRRMAEVERRSRNAEDKRRVAAYDETRKQDSVEAYRLFIAMFPGAAETVAAKKRLAAIGADENVYRDARGSEGKLDGYLTLFPKGRHADDARRELQDLRRRRMEADFGAARAAGTGAAYQAFLKQWPRSPRSGEARVALEAGSPTGRNPGGLSPRGLQLVAPRISRPPVVDGNADDPGWNTASELVAPLNGKAGAGEVRVRAVHDGVRVYFLLRWADPTHDVMNRPWNWDPGAKTYHQGSQLDDGASVMLFGTTAPPEACMLGGQEWEADNWLWRANWSEVSGLADDGVMRVGRDRLPQSNPYPNGDGSGQIWVSRQTDSGIPGWAFFIPLDFEGQVIGSYRATKARGSRADVSARGEWSEAGATPAWTVEFSRALDTRHSDDQLLRVGQPTAVAFAVYDHSGKADHVTSPLIRLDLRE